MGASAMSAADPHVARRRELRLAKRRLQAGINRRAREERRLRAVIDELRQAREDALGEIYEIDRELRTLDKFGVEGRE